MDIVYELQARWSFSGLILDHFCQFPQEEVDRILAAIRPTMCLLDLCLLRLMKAGSNDIQIPWV